MMSNRQKSFPAVGLSLALITFLLVTANGHEYFTAAVYEHVFLGNSTTDTAAEIVAKNLDYYDRATQVASSKGADIITFPDYGFFPYMNNRTFMRQFLETIPDPKSGRWNPCQQTEEFSQRPILRRLSCMARDNQIVVVTQVGDIQPCTKQQTSRCPDDGVFYHDAIVAFNRDGCLIGVSRKEHLFFEDVMDRPLLPQDPFFSTSFGTFAMFLRYDNMYKTAELAARNTSVDAFILSPLWVEIRPILSAIQYHSSLAVGTGTNLLASNVQYPGWITTGSGIYSGKMGALKYTFNIDNKAKVIVSKVPKYRSRGAFHNDGASITVITRDGTEHYHAGENEEAQNIPDQCNQRVLGQDISRDYRCFIEPTANFTFKKLEGSSGTVEACNNGLCCRATYDSPSMNESFYLGVFNGTYVDYGAYFWCKEVCFVLRCDYFNGSECNAFPAHSTTVFSKLELNMNTTTNYIYPSVLKSGYRLSPVNQWNFQVQQRDNDRYHVQLSYESNSNKPMLNAMLKGRCYDRDPQHFT